MNEAKMYTYVLREDFQVDFCLPENLTELEANRLAESILTTYLLAMWKADTAQ